MLRTTTTVVTITHEEDGIGSDSGTASVDDGNDDTNASILSHGRTRDGSYDAFKRNVRRTQLP